MQGPVAIQGSSLDQVKLAVLYMLILSACNLQGSELLKPGFVLAGCLIAVLTVFCGTQSVRRASVLLVNHIFQLSWMLHMHTSNDSQHIHLSISL